VDTPQVPMRGLIVVRGGRVGGWPLTLGFQSNWDGRVSSVRSDLACTVNLSILACWPHTSGSVSRQVCTCNK